MKKKLHTVTLRVDEKVLVLLQNYSNSIYSSIRVLLQLALESSYNDIYDPNFTSNEGSVFHITTHVDRFIYSMIQEYSSTNYCSPSEAVKRILNITIHCEGLL